VHERMPEGSPLYCTRRICQTHEPCGDGGGGGEQLSEGRNYSSAMRHGVFHSPLIYILPHDGEGEGRAPRTGPTRDVGLTLPSTIWGKMLQSMWCRKQDCLGVSTDSAQRNLRYRIVFADGPSQMDWQSCTYIATYQTEPICNYIIHDIFKVIPEPGFLHVLGRLTRGKQ
jgi:hypothetical protein